ncbi:MAG TPA: c-type cytochrome [Candidatus Baltobacteraceae bacterium]|nr:c-type cytochrome [Candidatus Baltobacteraceae bacterium]
MPRLSFLFAFAFALALAACGGGQPATSSPAASATFDPKAVPTGEVGYMVSYGHELIVHTRAHLGRFVTANMDCQACHVNAGTKARGGTFVGIAAQFPQWNARAKRVISLQDRLAECFLYSMNGRPPAYNSRDMEAMVAYITYLSRGTAIGAKPDPSARIAHFDPPAKPDPARGATIYTQKCSMCHGANGAGSAAFPPLWGATSFNNGAGMHRLWTMAGFVRYNMPQNAPGTLSDQEAYDVSAYVLSHSRPKFDKSKIVAFPSLHAGYF